MYLFEYILRNVIWIPTWPVWPPLIHLICITYVSSNFEQDDTWYVIPNIKMTTIYLICFSRQEEEIFSMTCHRTTKPNYNETETILNPNLNVYSAVISHVSKMWSSQQTEKSCEFWISQKSDMNTCIRFFLWILKATKERKLNSTPWEGEFLNR